MRAQPLERMLHCGRDLALAQAVHQHGQVELDGIGGGWVLRQVSGASWAGTKGHQVAVETPLGRARPALEVPDERSSGALTRTCHIFQECADQRRGVVEPSLETQADRVGLEQIWRRHGHAAAARDSITSAKSARSYNETERRGASGRSRAAALLAN